jgi:hypothetical protein
MGLRERVKDQGIQVGWNGYSTSPEYARILCKGVAS